MLDDGPGWETAAASLARVIFLPDWVEERMGRRGVGAEVETGVGAWVEEDAGVEVGAGVEELGAEGVGAVEVEEEEVGAT